MSDFGKLTQDEKLEAVAAIASGRAMVSDAGLFRKMALEALGVQGHPKADKLWELAWEYSHSYYEVWDYLQDMAVLLEE